MTTTGDLVGRMIPRPPDSPCGRVFRLDVSLGQGKRLQYADGVIAPDGCALARVRDTGTVVSAPGGIEDLVATMGDPRIRVVYRYEDGTV
ncbi:hypothetical protein ACIRLA_46470 [Streptomyces sp. NPDC102364]|uniref:hypothetical protein n=1 Tax=Streptomyces sp. NPDC102364 TaxID=3366161 RepID=UPI0038194D2A